MKSHDQKIQSHISEHNIIGKALWFWILPSCFLFFVFLREGSVKIDIINRTYFGKKLTLKYHIQKLAFKLP